MYFNFISSRILYLVFYLILIKLRVDLEQFPRNMIKMIDLINHLMFVLSDNLILLLLFVPYLLLSFLLIHRIIVFFYYIHVQDFHHFHLFLIRLNVLLLILGMLIMFLYLIFQLQNLRDEDMKVILDSVYYIFLLFKSNLIF